MIHHLRIISNSRTESDTNSSYRRRKRVLRVCRGSLRKGLHEDSCGAYKKGSCLIQFVTSKWYVDDVPVVGGIKTLAAPGLDEKSSWVFMNEDSSRVLCGMVGCNNGGGGGNFSKVKRLVWKCIWTRKQLFSGKFLFPIWDFRKAGTFPQKLLAHKTTYTYLSPSMGCWNIQENLESDLFWADYARFCVDFSPFCILAPRIQTCQLFYWIWSLDFLRRIF